MDWQFYLLGGLRVFYDDAPLDVPPLRAHGLLAALLLRPRIRARAQWAGLLFPELPEAQSRQRLSDLLYLLKRSLPALPLTLSRDTLSLAPASRWLDVEVFRQANGADIGAALAALALYRDDLLAGYCDDWLLEERETLRLHYLRLAWQMSETLFRQRQFEMALPVLEGLVQREPYDERAVQLLMQTYQAVGRRGAALRVYDRFVAVAAHELRIEPDARTHALAAELRAATTLAVAPPIVAPHDAAPEDVLQAAQMALARGEWAAVAAQLETLRRRAPAVDPAAWQLLAVDLALGQEQLARAETLLAMCPAPEQAAVLVRVARLALLRYDWPATCEAAQQALILAHEQADLRSESLALTVLAWAFYQLGDIPQALQSAERAVERARQVDDPPALVAALLVLARLFIVQRRDAAATAPLHEATQLACDQHLRPLLGNALGLEAWLQRNRGDLLAAQHTLDMALSLWRDLGSLFKEVRVLTDLAELSSLLGQHIVSLHHLDAAHALLQQLDAPVKLAINQYNRAFALLYAEDAAAAQAATLAREALAIFRAHAQAGWEAATLMLLGYALLIADQPVAALDQLHQSMLLYERLTEVEQLAELLAYQALAYLAQGQSAPALDYARRAVLATAQGGAAPEAIPDIYYAYAATLTATGSDEKAQTYFKRAYEALLAIAGQFHDEEARHALFHRCPLTRRLMAEVYARGLAAPGGAGGVSRRLPTASGTHTAPVAWTVDAGPPDQALRQTQGAIALRRARLQRLLREAQAQGLAPTPVDLAAVLNVSPRTVQRDLRHLRSTSA